MHKLGPKNSETRKKLLIKRRKNGKSKVKKKQVQIDYLILSTNVREYFCNVNQLLNSVLYYVFEIFLQILYDVEVRAYVTHEKKIQTLDERILFQM